MSHLPLASLSHNCPGTQSAKCIAWLLWTSSGWQACEILVEHVKPTAYECSLQSSARLHALLVQAVPAVSWEWIKIICWWHRRIGWLWVRSNLGQRAQADLSSETLKSPLGVSWGTTAALCAQRQEGGGTDGGLCPLSQCLAAVPLTGWLLQAAVGGLLQELGSQTSHSPRGFLQLITSECLEHLMCLRSRNLWWMYNQDICCTQTSTKEAKEGEIEISICYCSVARL